MSEPNISLGGKSVYQVVSSKEFRRMQKVSNGLRQSLNGFRKKRAKFCASDQVWFLADRNYTKETERLAKKYHEFHMARYLLDNYQYREDLKDLTKDCEKVDEKRWVQIKEIIRQSFPKWLDDSIKKRIKKVGDGQKNPISEHEDFIRLSEAVANKEKSSKDVILVTGDMHFICYQDKIESDFKISIFNYFN